MEVLAASVIPRKIVMKPFCFKQFDPSRVGAILINFDKEAFTARIN